MRWDELRVDADEGRRLPGYRDPAVVRTFDAPEALDTRFYEVRSRSALNRVPASSRVPFRWTINPYRGCSHACSYCMAGETPILMADGCTKSLADIRVGDAIYGTIGAGRHRRYAVTHVLAHWATHKPSFRIGLEEGTELVASGDHRFLSHRGWKHVTAAEQGSLRRPHLKLGDELLGTGGFTAAPQLDQEYRLGYLCGLARGDGHTRLGVASIERLGARRLFDITTGTGDFIANGVVSHNCFARPTHTYLDLNAREDFEHEIVVKVNVPEVLRAELARPSWKREHVALGTNTDPYQWVEGRYRLMPDIWEALGDAGTPCSILTKSPLLLRDVEVMKRVHARSGLTANLSVPTLDERTWRATEPRTPNPRARLEAVAELNRAGIPTGVLIAPLMPGVNDSPQQVERIIALATEAGATGIGGIALHMRGEVREIFFDWLRAQRPDLVPRYEELYRRGAYAKPEERRRLAALVGSGRKPSRFRAEPEGGSAWSGGPGGRTAAERARADAQESLF